MLSVRFSLGYSFETGVASNPRLVDVPKVLVLV